MASLNNLLNRASDYRNELDFIEERITTLNKAAEAIITNGFMSVEMIIEAHPKNGAVATVMPLFAINSMMPYLAGEEPAPEPLQVGFQRFYKPSEVKNEDMLTIGIPLDANIAMAVIDRTIQRLKARRTVILKRSRLILKAD